MSGMITPGVTPFDRSEFITDERFNLMVAELAAKIAAEGGAGTLKPEDVINTLLSTEIAKPLSANQGKVLKGLIDDNGSAIGQIADAEVIDLNTINLLSFIDINAGYPQMHHFRVIPSSTPNGAPEISWGVGYYAIQTFGDTFCVYIGTEKTFIARKAGETWSAWKEIATTEKYVMQASDMRNGWILGHGNIIQKIGNRVFARFTITSGATAINNVACNVPVRFRPSAETFITVKGNFDTSDNPVNQFMAVFPDGNIQIKYKDSKPNIFIETSWEV